MMMEYLHTILLVAIALMLLVVIVNVVGFPALRKRRPSAPVPLVSVLMPVRNEEAVIGRALEGVLKQDYPAYEVVVLDDNSTDRTGALAGERARVDARVRLVQGQKLPRGWVGKAFACHQLAREAKGDLLLFIDADTMLAPGAISGGVEELHRSSADLLTVIPRQHMSSFWEKVLLPLLHFSTFCYLPMPLVSRTRSPKLAMANGQFMLFRKVAYAAIGGHESVRDALVEDVWLARRVKEEGLRLAIRYGGELVECRMYTSLSEIWAGFSKNLFPGLGYSVPMITGVVLFSILTSVLSFVLLVHYLILGEIGAGVGLLVAGEAGGVLLIRLLLSLRFDMNLWPILLHPVAMLVFVAIAVNSALWVLTGRGSRWKGRVYGLRHDIANQ
ncbi:MAG: glycosyltransferase family 2 protein [Bacteroidota bacterium]